MKFNKKEIWDKCNYSDSELYTQFRKTNKKQRIITTNYFNMERRIIEGDYTSDVILLIVSEHQIYQGDNIGICEDTCQFGLHYQRAKYYRRNINTSLR